MNDKDIINQANSVSLYNILNHYNVTLNNRKTVCPFPFHKGGRENTASFVYYPETNTFWCFGCNTGVDCCTFVSSMEGINKIDAAFRILSAFNSNVEYSKIERKDYCERAEIMNEFSKSVRIFYKDNLTDKCACSFIESICKTYDILNLKYDLSNDALRLIVDQLKEKIDCYGRGESINFGRSSFR